jgi:hypothetical protein
MVLEKGLAYLVLSISRWLPVLKKYKNSYDYESEI